ncbi:Tim44/TimA family putative adaptor protein [Gluconobacter morbifer]|nr:Tim44/TimA family putative adaptor protein [Gluconobacter morbifer]
MSSDKIHLPSGLMDSASAHFPWDIVVLAVLAVALGIRLYRVLGRRIGMQGVRQERPGPFSASAPDSRETRTPPPLPAGAQPNGEGAPPAPQVEYDIPAPATRVGTILGEIAQIAPGFTPSAFLKEAESAFRRIIPAFAVGDKPALAGLLTFETEEAFSQAIDARTEAGEVQRSDLRGIDSLAILDAFLTSSEAEGRIARIEVRIVSRQINLLSDRNGDPIQGTEAVTEFHDLWLFEYATSVSPSNWRLAASRPA